MPKTTKDLMLAIADMVGAREAMYLQATIQNENLEGVILDRPLSDEEYELQYKNLARNFHQPREKGTLQMKRGELREPCRE